MELDPKYSLNDTLLDEHQQKQGPNPYFHRLHVIYEDIVNYFENNDYDELDQCFTELNDIVCYGVFSVDDEFQKNYIFQKVLQCLFENHEEQSIVLSSLRLLVSLTALDNDFFTKYIGEDSELLQRICFLATLNDIPICCSALHLLANIASENETLQSNVFQQFDLSGIWSNFSDDSCPSTVKVEAAGLLYSLTKYQLDESIRVSFIESLTESILESIEDEDVTIELFRALSNIDLTYPDAESIAIAKGFLTIDINQIPKNDSCLSFYLKYCCCGIIDKTYTPNISALIDLLKIEDEYQNSTKSKVLSNTLYALLVSCETESSDEDPRYLMLDNNILSYLWEYIKSHLELSDCENSTQSSNISFLSVCLKLLEKLLSVCESTIIQGFITEHFVSFIVDILIDSDDQTLETSLCSLLIQFIYVERSEEGTNNVAELCIANDLIESIKEKHEEPKDELVIAVDKLENMLTTESEEQN